MTTLGWGNALAMTLGGGPSDIENIWKALRDAVGKGGAAAEDSTMEDLWRQARARVIGAAASMVERAAIQSLPDRATDALEYYEDLLGIVPAEGDTDADRRIEAARRFTIELKADGANLEATLQAIEATAEILAVNTDLTIVSQFGWAFEWRPSTGFYGSNDATNFPNFTTEFLVTVQVTLPVGVTLLDAITLVRLRETLNDMLPAWVDFAVSQVGPSGPGFYLDGGPDGTSLLDLTAFTS